MPAGRQASHDMPAIRFAPLWRITALPAGTHPVVYVNRALLQLSREPRTYVPINAIACAGDCRRWPSTPDNEIPSNDRMFDQKQLLRLRQ